MALIDCPECGKQVSDAARACPGCGVSIADAAEARAAGASLTTTQITSKKLKLQQVASVLLTLVGFISLVTVNSSPEERVSAAPIPTALFVIGIGWFVVTRIRIWWHHK